MRDTLREHPSPPTPDDLARMAAMYTARPTETSEELLARPAVTDLAERRRRALGLLRVLEAHARRLRADVDPYAPLVQSLLRAAYTCDETELSRLGIDIEYAWFDDILAAMINGAPFLEFETVGPYAARHLDASGELRVSTDRLSPDEVAGMLLMAVFRDLGAHCGNARVVSLLDDVNVHAQTPGLTPEQRDRWVVDIVRLFTEARALHVGDVPGRDYVMVRESSCLARLPELIDRLGQSKDGRLEISGDDVVFLPSPTFVDKLALISKHRKREFRKHGIALVRDGEPTCQALDAAGFLDDLNRTIVHVIMLDQRFASEQDKSYALLRALDVVTQDRHYNVFFDSERLSPPVIAYTIVELLAEQIRRFLRMFSTFERWERVDHERVVAVVMAQLRRDGVGASSGPAVLLSPYVAGDGSVEMLESGPTDTPYLRKTVNMPARNSPWKSFEDQMRREGRSYMGPLSTVQRKRAVVNGAAFSLPTDTYDLALSYLADELPMSRTRLRVAVRSLAAAVKPGGVLTVVHTLGHGAGSTLPGLGVGVEDIEEAYRDADMEIELHPVGSTSGWGHDPLVVVVARKLR